MKVLPEPKIRFFLVLMGLLISICSNTYTQLHTGSQANSVVRNSGAGTGPHDALVKDCETPTAVFTSAGSPLYCLSSAVDFKDGSSSLTLPITKWSWNFGDGGGSALSNPSHTYNTYGDYDVTLTVTNSGGCSAMTKHTIHVKPNVLAAFDVQPQSCPGQAVTFTDHSTTAYGTIVQWIWNPGDGTPSQPKNDNSPFVYTYTKSGTYTATLEVVTATNCASDLTPKNITVLAATAPDFTLPDVCQSDGFAQFTDASVIPGGNSGYTYLWNFGDALADAANPNTSTDQNPKHHYSQQGNYTVTLTLTTPYGCASQTKPKQFVVNGINPIAKFSVTNPVCAGDSVVLTNQSNVDFGNITKLEIFWDYDQSPGVSNVFYRAQNQIPANNIFKHFYADLTTTAHHIKMIASSGQVCISDPSFDQTITVSANPTVTLSPLNSVCVDAGPQQITENKNGFTGTGIFSGAGISATGLFDPAVAGAGTHTIHYLFTSDGGCTYVDSLSVSVYNKPAITLVSTATAIEGGGTKLNPQAVGDSLTYQWSPAVGISNPTILNPVFSPSQNTIYTLTVTRAGGCAASAQVNISVLKTPLIPNAFTPNNDGVNDTWDIKYLNTYPDATVDVFSRSGAKVYTSIGYPVPWDGKFNGKDLPFGVYYYIINPKSGRQPMTGSLTIIK